MCFPTKFKFDLRQMVEVGISGEIGEVKAQGKWATGNTAYQVLYRPQTVQRKSVGLMKSISMLLKTTVTPAVRFTVSENCHLARLSLNNRHYRWPSLR